MRKPREIKEAIRALQKHRKTIPPFSAAGIPKRKMLDEKIATLGKIVKASGVEILRFRKETMDALAGRSSDYILNARIEAIEWAMGKEEYEW